MPYLTVIRSGGRIDRCDVTVLHRVVLHVEPFTGCDLARDFVVPAAVVGKSVLNRDVTYDAPGFSDFHL